MAGHGIKRAAKPGGHMRHEPRLAAARRPLEQDRQAVFMRRREKGNLVALRQVEGGVSRPLQVGVGSVHLHHSAATWSGSCLMRSRSIGPGSIISRPGTNTA